MANVGGVPPVYLITIDSLRADFFDDVRFPNCWDYFTNDFMQFPTAYANGIATPLAFPSILADEHVSSNGALSWGATTLAERLPKPSVAIPNNLHLSKARGYHRGFSQFDIDIGLLGYLRRAIVLRSTRKSGIDSLRNRLPFLEDSTVPLLYRPAGRMVYELKRAIQSYSPAFTWGHFMDPHGPYHPALVFDRRLSISIDDFERIHNLWKADAPINHESLDILKRIYEEKIKYVDRRLAELLVWLERTSRYENALIIVTADHGQLMGEGNQFGHDWNNEPVDELLRVPLLVKPPGSRGFGEVLSHPVQHLDIHPTVAEYLLTDQGTNPESVAVHDASQRFIIAKSNSAVRGISEEGDVIREVNGLVRTTGNPPQALIESVTTAEPASVTTDVGQETMTETERRKVNERLEGLGYR